MAPSFASFNGAAAVQRRKLGRSTTIAARTFGASMGPPLFSGGNDAGEIEKADEGQMLQWGRRCSAAEIALQGLHAVLSRSGFNGAAAVQRRK